MNRQQRRQRRGQESEQVVADDAEAQVETHLSQELAPATEPRVTRPPVEPTRHRVAPRQFLHEVNVEMRKVAWPTRAETFNYSTVVLVTLAFMMGLIFLLDLVFSKAAGWLFNP